MRRMVAMAVLAAAVVAPVSAAETDWAADFERMELESGRWSQRNASGEAHTGFSLAIDNDLFSPSEQDRDYTGGLAVAFSGPAAARYWLTLDPALRFIDRRVLEGRIAPDDTSVHYSAQIGMMSFTPQEIEVADVIEDDRPYASLLHATNVRQYVSGDGKSVIQTGLTVGVLGLSLTSDIHAGIHDLVGSAKPQGYAHQISAGGEPTARYVIGKSTLRQQRLAFGSGLIETKTTAEMSLGYLTEASYGISTRFGAIDTPWWTFNPERVDYIAQPSAVPQTRGSSGEFYFWMGAKLRLRAYNSFLQGQFRHSDLRLSSDELEHVIGEAWMGLTGQLANGTQLSYAVRYQTAEIREGRGHRDPVWAGVMFTHSFR